jgi:glycogen debranching enzyme
MSHEWPVEPGIPTRRLPWEQMLARGAATRLEYEWLVTNGLGGSASGTVVGVVTRQHHGLLVALPAPHGRTVMLSHLEEWLRPPANPSSSAADRLKVSGHAESITVPERWPADAHLVEFRLELGLPIWRYVVQEYLLEKRIVLPHGQNTTQVAYRLLAGPGPARLELRPFLGFRPHDVPVDSPLFTPYTVTAAGPRYEIAGPPALPLLRLRVHAEQAQLVLDGGRTRPHHYAVEESRGYAADGLLWTPGQIKIELALGSPATLIASTEPWDVLDALTPDEVEDGERARRRRLLGSAPTVGQAGAQPHPRRAMPGDNPTDLEAELMLAADQFIITPVARAADVTRAEAAGDLVRTVIAGYPWFTDWGRDTMISLEGLTLTTGRTAEAGSILRMFARHVRDGLIPNLFPEGEHEGLYHTADATLWYFHALDRYLTVTDDRALLQDLLPILLDITRQHQAGTRFGIGVDPADGLLRQGEEGFQLTWMDAKVDDWVVTPRRGKAVEINALWYNALRLLAGWLHEAGDGGVAARLDAQAERARASFNVRFWYAPGGHLYDVIDGAQGDDAACRPNQLFAISLAHPILDRERWTSVLGVVREQLLTPVGLRSLAPSHPDYQPRYTGTLRARDAAYHQGTVWGWLAGPFVDAWLRVYPDDLGGARQALAGFEAHLSEACVGTISEVFDAEPPFTPRGCVAQAWSVAEVLRALVRLS